MPDGGGEIAPVRNEALENGGSMSNVRTTIVTDRTAPGYWRVTLGNPPINAIDRACDEFFDLVQENRGCQTISALSGLEFG